MSEMVFFGTEMVVFSAFLFFFGAESVFLTLVARKSRLAGLVGQLVFFNAEAAPHRYRAPPLSRAPLRPAAITRRVLAALGCCRGGPPAGTCHLHQLGVSYLLLPSGQL